MRRTLISALCCVFLAVGANAQNIGAIYNAGQLDLAMDSSSSIDIAYIENSFVIPSTIERRPNRPFVITSAEYNGKVPNIFTLSGNNTSGLIKISSLVDFLSSDLAITNLNLVNAKNGAIHIYTPQTGTNVANNIYDLNIENVTFKDNKAYSEYGVTDPVHGAALHVDSNHNVTISNTLFQDNTTEDTSYPIDSAIPGGSPVDKLAKGGAIYYNGNDDVSLTISSSNFEGNKAQLGGAIYSNSTLTLGNVAFDSNYAQVDGGAIVANDKFTGNIFFFTENSAQQNGGAIAYFGKELSLKNGTASKNSALNGSGGAFYIASGAADIENIEFSENTAGKDGGAVYIGWSGNDAVNISSSSFSKNSATGNGGAIYTSSSNLTIAGVHFEDNSATGSGGAISIEKSSNVSATDPVTTIKNSSFINNTSSGMGGAIYTNAGSLNLIAENGNNINFQGNTDAAGANAVMLDGTSTLNLNAASGGAINFYDKIVGISGTTININGSAAQDTNIPSGAPKEGAVNFYQGIEQFNGDFNAYGGTVGLFADMTFNTSSFNINNSTLNLMNDAVNTINITGSASFTNTNVKIDVDALNNTADFFQTGGASGSLNITDMTIIKDAAGNSTGSIKISNELGITVDENKKYYGPIYEYLASLVGSDEFVLDKTGGVNRSIMATQVAANGTVFNNNYLASLFLNRTYLLMRPEVVLPGDSGRAYTPWVTPFGGHTKLNFKNGMEDVKNSLYGVSFGLDFPSSDTRNDMLFVPTLFGAYYSAEQDYDGLTAKKHSLLLGGMLTFAAEKFYGAALVQGSNGRNKADFSGNSDDFDAFTLTAAAKAEAKIDMFDEYLFVWPSIMVAYNFQNSQNYTTSLGAQIQADDFSSIQIMPSLRIMTVIYNWNPYVQVSYNYNAVQNGKVTTDGIEIPEFEMKDYLKYTLGSEAALSEKYSLYTELSFYSGGATGFTATLGFRGYMDINNFLNAPFN